MTEKKYRLIKDVPDCAKGAIYIYNENTRRIHKDGNVLHGGYSLNSIAEGWFEEVLPLSEPVKESTRIVGFSFSNSNDSGVWYTFGVDKGIHTNKFNPIEKAILSVLNNDTVVEDKNIDWGIIINGLNIIANWELPATGKFWDEEKTRPTSYESEYGSNGVRDYMKNIAANLLSSLNNSSDKVLEQEQKEQLDIQNQVKHDNPFIWDDKLVLEFCNAHRNSTEIIAKYYLKQDSIYAFKKCHQSKLSTPVEAGKQRKQSPYNDKNGTPIFEGDTVKGVGVHSGQSEVFFEYGKWQPFDYLNDYDGNNYEIVTPEKSSSLHTGKEWEIVSFVENEEEKTDDVPSVMFVKDIPKCYQVEQYLKPDSCWNIHSVRRIKDGVVFSIGDWFEGGMRKGRINNFYVNEGGGMFLNINSDEKLGLNINVAKLISKRNPSLTPPVEDKPVLFTTEDGVDIIEGMIWWTVDKNFHWYESNNLVSDEKQKYFSTKESAEQYIQYNKPCLSFNEILESVGGRIGNYDQEQLKKTIKNKLNK